MDYEMDYEQDVDSETLENHWLGSDIELTVHVWYYDDGIKYNKPTTIKLKVDETLFDRLNSLVPYESWGSVSMRKDWYIRSLLENPKTGNIWAEFDKHDTEERVSRLEFSVRNWYQSRDIPTIFVRDLRDIAVEGLK
jgi:hypothetical protein